MLTFPLRSALAIGVVTLATTSTASAQLPGPFGGPFGGSATTGSTSAPYGQPTYGAPAGVPMTSGGYQSSSDFEIGTLYVTAAAYGVGTGIWLDAETGLDDPGLRFVAPAVLGVAAPAAVFALDHPKMPRGVPAAISAGLLIGAGEGVGIWSVQYTHANEADQWGFKGLSRGAFIGSTVGGIAGAAVGFLQEPSPKTSLLLGSGSLWGGAIGTMLGYGGTSVGQGYGNSNDAASTSGLVGYNLGLIAAGGLSTVWVPTYKQLTAMWLGAGAGFLVTSPVYLFYAGSSDNHPAKRGLIFQGVGTTLGIIAGGLLTFDDHDDVAQADPYSGKRPSIAQVTGVGAMPLPGGAGAQITGVLF